MNKSKDTTWTSQKTQKASAESGSDRNHNKTNRRTMKGFLSAQSGHEGKKKKTVSRDENPKCKQQQTVKSRTLSNNERRKSRNKRQQHSVLVQSSFKLTEGNRLLAKHTIRPFERFEKEKNKFFTTHTKAKFRFLNFWYLRKFYFHKRRREKDTKIIAARHPRLIWIFAFCCCSLIASKIRSRRVCLRTSWWTDNSYAARKEFYDEIKKSEKRNKTKPISGRDICDNKRRSNLVIVGLLLSIRRSW